MGYGKIGENKRTVRHYLRIYFLSIFLSFTILMVGSFIRTQTLCANSKTCKSDLIVQVNNDIIGFFQGHEVVPPKVDLTKEILKPTVAPEKEIPNKDKHIYVDLSTQNLYAYEGSEKIMQTLISSGKWGRTPVGNYNIWIKLPVTRMAGGEGADAYDLPNVQWVMYFYKDFGFHTAYWHNNFGHPMSHGCVNMRLIDARALYAWADGPASGQKGTAVSVCSRFTGPNQCMQD